MLQYISKIILSFESFQIAELPKLYSISNFYSPFRFVILAHKRIGIFGEYNDRISCPHHLDATSEKSFFLLISKNYQLLKTLIMLLLVRSLRRKIMISHLQRQLHVKERPNYEKCLPNIWSRIQIIIFFLFLIYLYIITFPTVACFCEGTFG